MQFENQHDQQPLSPLQRLARAKALSAQAALKIEEEKNLKKRLRKESLTEVATASHSRSESYKKLATENGDYNALKDIPFETFLKTLARELKKDGQMPLNFDEKWNEIKEIKKALAEFDEGSADFRKDEEIRQEYEAVRAEVVQTMREWAQIISAWFAEHGEEYEAKSRLETSPEVEALLNEPLFTAEFRTAHETFDSVSYRTIREYADGLAEKTRKRLLEFLLIKDISSQPNSDLKESSKSIISHYTNKYPDASSFFAKIREIVSMGASVDLDKKMADFVYAHNSNKEKESADLLKDFEKLIIKADAVERVVEAQRYFVEQQMRGVVETINNAFETDEERQDALLFVTHADREAHMKPHLMNIGPNYLNLNIDSYGGNPPPEWIIKVYKRMNEAHLFKELMCGGDVEDVRSRINEGQILRAISKEPAYGDSETDKTLHENVRFTESKGWVQIITPKDSKEVKVCYPLNNLNNNNTFEIATLDPEMIAQIESLWKVLEDNRALLGVNRVGLFRSFFSHCSIQGVAYKSERTASGGASFQMMPHILSSGLIKKVKDFGNTVDLRLAAAEPTTLQKLSELAKQNGVIEITSPAAGVEIVSAMQSLVNRYLLEERSQLENTRNVALQAVQTEKDAAARELGKLQQRIDDAIKPHAAEAMTHQKRAEQVEEELARLQSKVVSLENSNHDLTSRLLIQGATPQESTKVDRETEPAPAPAPEQGVRDIQRQIQEALQMAATMKSGLLGVGGDGARYKALVDALSSIK